MTGRHAAPYNVAELWTERPLRPFAAKHRAWPARPQDTPEVQPDTHLDNGAEPLRAASHVNGQRLLDSSETSSL